MIKTIFWLFYLTGTFTTTIMSLVFLNLVLLIYTKRFKLYERWFKYKNTDNHKKDIFILHTKFHTIGEWMGIIMCFPIMGIVLPIYIMSCLTELFLNRFVIYRVKNLFMSIFDKVFPNDNEE